ncbi:MULTISPECIES: helix-turn-helix domain-containing protein [Catenuloplanes]|uniref:AraC-like DNA-binding protein n=1 Tax=Catenuloplanes niger TaxID=587534 RepID=A0AAE4A348_9ACTN|nr:helix-turn-helix domain-containing protein [Catenuloplanes niger]MDR7328305.1 AraC-like DNA-binding protein [Catenuloplanes niger]
MSSPRGTVLVDTARPGSGGHDDRFTRISGCAPLPAVTRSGVHGRDSRAGDVTVTDFHTTAGVRTAVDPHQPAELRLYLVRRGVWTLDYDRGAFPVRSGGFLAYRSTGLTGFATAPRTTGHSVGIPLRELHGLTVDAPLTGSAAAPEVRLLLAHAGLLHDTIDDLSDAGVDAARNALVELTRGVLRRAADTTEPALAPALARAARELADRLLTRADLTPALLARDLHVSVRTLSRAFATTGEPAAAYIRRRRLEEARHALAAGHTVSEAAARFRFADSSHFIRAFRGRYAETPAQYAKRTRP